MYFNKEPPGKGHGTHLKMHPAFYKLFSISYTYRRDSVIPNLYGKVIPRDTPADSLNSVLQDTTNVKWKKVPADISKLVLTRNLKHKTKGILWMVSHCKTDSKREEYVKKLEEQLSTLSIDILGKCGKDILPSNPVNKPLTLGTKIRFRM